MTRLTLLLIAFGALVQAQAPKRVLYVTHSAGFRHDSIIVSRESMRTLSPRLEFTATEDLSAISAENLRNYDAILFFTSGELALSQAQRTALLEFIRRGGGFGGVHSATDTLYTWPEYGDLIGGYFDGHPWVQTVRIDVEDPSHPATAHLGASFEILDEIYQFREFERSRVRVLMTLDTTSVALNAEGAHRGTEDFPLAWVRPYGSGRVFYSALGHFDETWRDQRFLRMMEGALLWLTGQAAESTAQPRTASPAELTALANAATGNPVDTAAAGSLVSIYGRNLTNGGAMSGSYTNRLAGTTLRIGDRRVSLLYASPGQVNALIPADIPTGPATVTLEPAGGARAARAIEIAPSAPGVFAVTFQPRAIVVWATGLGGLTPEARLNGTPARILFTGTAPGFAGLDQINVEATTPGSMRLQLTVAGAMFFDATVDVPR
jgi:type 1 glutamine amidotransferase